MDLAAGGRGRSDLLHSGNSCDGQNWHGLGGGERLANSGGFRAAQQHGQPVRAGQQLGELGEDLHGQRTLNSFELKGEYA